MVELLVARKKDSNLTFRVIKRNKNEWGPADFGSSGKDMSFEMVIRQRDPMLIAYLLTDLQRLGYPIEKAIAKFKELTEKPDLFFLH